MRTYNRKTTMQSWSKESLRLAMEQIQASKTTVQKASLDYNIPLSTLKRRIAKQAENKENAFEVKLGRFKCTFSPELEKVFVEHLLELDKVYFGLSPIELRRLAFDFAETYKINHRFNKEHKIAGEDWYLSFMKRHPSLTLRTPEKTSFARASCFNKVVVGKFYTLLEELMSTYQFSPSRIYNVDESGISAVPNYIPKVISQKGRKQVGGLVSAERGETVTCVFCCNAAGNFIPPLLIFPRKKINLELREGCPPDTLAVFHPSGWMQTEIFCPTWFNHFCKFAKPSQDDPVLLLLDGHATHIKNLTLLKAAQEQNVHILCFPPHTSHKLQPLDRSFMNPLKTYYSQECSVYLRNHPGQVITLKKVGGLLGKAYMRAAVPLNATNGFECTGIYPMNRFKFHEEDFAPSIPTNVENFCDASVQPIPSDNVSENQRNNENGVVMLPVINNCLVDVCNINILHDEPVTDTSQPSTSAHNNCDKSLTVPVLEISDKEKINKILPVPKVDSNQVRKSSNRKGRTAIVTSSSYIKELEQNRNALTKKKLPVRRKIIKEERQEVKKKFIKKERNEEDCSCLVCQRLYSQSIWNEQWIQCQECNLWAHEDCVKHLIKTSLFLCETCLPKVIEAHLKKKL